MDKNKKIKIFEDLVAMRTINGHELQVANYIKKLFDQVGIQNQVLPFSESSDRANLVAEVGSGKPVLVVSGHMDVVDVTKDGWNTDPFKVTKKGDELYGRGTTDMKGGLAAMVIALIELKENNVHIPGTVRFLATAGEEVGQPGAELLQKQGYIDDADALLIGEPSGFFREVYANKGEIDITITAEGKTAHSSMPFLGINAVEHLLEVLHEIKAKMSALAKGKSNKVLGDTVFNIDTINGGYQVNAIPGTAKAELNVRTIPELSNDEILRELNTIIENYNQNNPGKIELSVDMNIVPIIGKRDSRLINVVEAAASPYRSKQKLTESMAKMMAQEAKVAGAENYQPGDFIREGVSGGTDASKFLVDKQFDFDYVVYGPGNETPHQDNECVSETMYLDFIEIYKKIFSTFGA